MKMPFVAKDSGDFIASWAFHTHDIGTGALHQAPLLVFPLLSSGRDEGDALRQACCHGEPKVTF